MWRKAQGATEYLIILAVVIIIALIVVGVMGGIPGIGGSGKSKASAAYWSTTEVAIDSAKVAGTTAELRLSNKQRNGITVVNVSLGSDSAATLLTLNPGQVDTYTLNLSTACAAGNSYSYPVVIYYNDTVTGGVYPVVGDQNLEGSCSG